MSGNFAIKGGGVGPLMANAILNFHFDFLTPSLIHCESQNALCVFRARIQVLSEIVQNVSNWSTRVPDDQIHLGPLLFTIWATLELPSSM